MSETETRFWQSTQFYKGYLPAKDAIEARKYVVLACYVSPHVTHEGSGIDSSNVVVCSTTEFPLQPHSPVFDQNFHTCSHSHESHIMGNKPDGILRSPALSCCAPEMDTSFDGEAPLIPEMDAAHNYTIAFYMFRKKDVMPPPLKYTLSQNHINHCFFFCEKLKCNCENPHVVRGAWRLRLDTLERTALTVNQAGQYLRVDEKEAIPSAGYYFALGLVHMKAVLAVVPTMCRFNKKCKHGYMCLYIHADVKVEKPKMNASDVLLRDYVLTSGIDFLPEDEQDDFFRFLGEEGIATVGDLQVLGVAAFESLANRIPAQWAEAFLVISVLRNLDRKANLADILCTFPRVSAPVTLPPYPRRVGELLTMPYAEFYSMGAAPHVMNACEMIRERYATDEDYNVITLSKEPEDSFFVRVTNIITAFRGKHAHCSWRKHDPTRPVVTSIITYVDGATCNCTLNENNGVYAFDRTRVFSFGEPDYQQEIGTPRGSWCSCPRRWVVAVNYELSTPSGSRCSEQNAMGKLASMGVPTWAVREVFVHGAHCNKEANPLFPCGACENMLQKVTKDVTTQYGGEMILYMYDATVPKKVVYLPVQEISHRFGSSFKRFVASDLREHQGR